MTSTPPPCVAVASDQALVAEAISAALRDRGFGTLVLRWPLGIRAGARARARPRRGSASTSR